jgi:hypothetical protein
MPARPGSLKKSDNQIKSLVAEKTNAQHPPCEPPSRYSDKLSRHFGNFSPVIPAIFPDKSIRGQA